MAPNNVGLDEIKKSLILKLKNNWYDFWVFSEFLIFLGFCIFQGKATWQVSYDKEIL